MKIEITIECLGGTNRVRTSHNGISLNPEVIVYESAYPDVKQRKWKFKVDWFVLGLCK